MLVIKGFKLFDLLIFSIFLLNSSSLFAETDSKTEAKPASESEALPAWLAGKSFHIRDRLVLSFDGSEEAGEILRSSESVNRLLFKDSLNWRGLREHPTEHYSKQVLRQGDDFFVLSSRNRLVPSSKEIEESFWLEIVFAPYRMSKKMGLDLKAEHFADWLQKLSELETEFTTDTGSIRVERSSDKKVETLRIILQGYYFHDAKTKVNIKEEWSLEYGLNVSPKQLKESLVGGSS